MKLSEKIVKLRKQKDKILKYHIGNQAEKIMYVMNAAKWVFQTMR